MNSNEIDIQGFNNLTDPQNSTNPEAQSLIRTFQSSPENLFLCRQILESNEQARDHTLYFASFNLSVLLDQFSVQWNAEVFSQFYEWCLNFFPAFIANPKFSQLSDQAKEIITGYFGRALGSVILMVGLFFHHYKIFVIKFFQVVLLLILLIVIHYKFVLMLLKKS